jgi:hypothetical protein
MFSQDVEVNIKSQDVDNLLLKQNFASQQGTDENQILAFPPEQAQQELTSDISSQLFFKHPAMHQFAKSNEDGNAAEMDNIDNNMLLLDKKPPQTVSNPGVSYQSSQKEGSSPEHK